MYEVANGRKQGEAVEWDDLLRRAVREYYGSRGKPLLASPITLDSKKRFLKRLFSNARSIDAGEPQEISKSTVDVNEKVYTNTGGFEDETTVKIVNSVENTEDRNYQVTTTKGVKWGLDANVGLQFGLPQVGVGGSAKLGGNYERSRAFSVTEGKSEQQKTEHQSHHEETVSIPPGKMAKLRMTTYKVRYKLEYTMEYRIAKGEGVFVRTDMCGLGFCYYSVFVSASQLLQPLPGYREDEEFVYFTQEGELRWIADQMYVTKTFSDV